MSKKVVSTFLMIVIFALLMSACNMQNNPSTQQMDAMMLEATVNAMVEVSMQEEADKQAEIEAAVQATQVVMESQTTPVMVDEDYYKLSEEELENMINEAVDAALEASAEVSQSTSDATYDNSVSDEEVVYVSYYVAYADEAIAYAESLMDVYYDMYGVYADDAISALYEIESELESIAVSLDSMEELLYQGADAVNAALVELNETAMQVDERIGTAQANTQDWLNNYQVTLDVHQFDWQNMQPNMEAIDRSQMVEMINSYVGEIRTGINDGVLNLEEITRITQSGVNAQAAIGKFGNGQFQGISDSIDNLSSLAQKGNHRELSSGVSNFSANLPDFGANVPDGIRRP